MTTKQTIHIDGSLGEGGGQVLRSALALSMVTGKALRLDKIRAGRKKPGLMRQHLTCVKAATAISGATTTDVEIGSQAISFKPGTVQPGDYQFAVGTAGSAVLVLQTILPPLLTASGPSTIRIEGGTHNQWAPPFDFLVRSFLPQIERLGPKVTATLERPGFYPAGGGAFTVTIEPVAQLKPAELVDRGEITAIDAEAIVADVPLRVAEREFKKLQQRLPDLRNCEIREVADSAGPGNYLMVVVGSDSHEQVFSGFGERQVPAERVATGVAKAVLRYLEAGVPVDDYLADQLLLPYALAGGGAFRTTSLSEHATTNMAVIRQFLDVHFDTDRHDRLDWLVQVRKD